MNEGKMSQSEKDKFASILGGAIFEVTQAAFAPEELRKIVEKVITKDEFKLFLLQAIMG